MKKLTLIVMLFMCIGLVGCGNSEKRVAVSDNPADEIKTTLNLEAVKNGVSLNAKLDTTAKKYYDVKIASDAKSTLFYSIVEIDEYLNQSFKGINLKALSFNNKLISTDIANFFLELNNEDYGLDEEKLGKEFTTTTSSGELFGRLNSTNFIGLPSDYDSSSEKTNALVVVYLPVYCIYHEGNQDQIKAFYLVPVYYNFVIVDGAIEDSNLEGLTKYNVSLDDNGLLPSKTA